MSYLEHFADEIRRRGSQTMKWLVLRNLYFSKGTEQDGWVACMAWAKNEGFSVSVAWKNERAIGGGIPNTVTFSSASRNPQ